MTSLKNETVPGVAFPWTLLNPDDEGYQESWTQYFPKAEEGRARVAVVLPKELCLRMVEFKGHKRMRARFTQDEDHVNTAHRLNVDWRLRVEQGGEPPICLANRLGRDKVFDHVSFEITEWIMFSMPNVRRQYDKDYWVVFMQCSTSHDLHWSLQKCRVPMVVRFGFEPHHRGLEAVPPQVHPLVDLPPSLKAGQGPAGRGAGYETFRIRNVDDLAEVERGLSIPFHYKGKIRVELDYAPLNLVGVEVLVAQSFRRTSNALAICTSIEMLLDTWRARLASGTTIPCIVAYRE
jgi:hypothetical protein